MTKPDIAINYATVRERIGMDEFLYKCADRDLTHVSIWADEVNRIGLDRINTILEETNLRVLGYNRAGPLTAESAEQRERLKDAALHEITQAAALGSDHIMVFTGGLPPGSRDLIGTRRQVDDTIASLVEHARREDVRLALEPLHPMLMGDRTVLSSLNDANNLCARLGSGVGVVIDVYHVWWDLTVEAEIERAGSYDRILGFHVNDWLVPTKHLLRDRGMMGDGIIDLGRLERLVRKAGYRGPIEVEIFSDHWWAQDPDLVLDTAIRRCREIFTLPVE